MGDGNVLHLHLPLCLISDHLSTGNTAFAIEHQLRKLKKNHQGATPKPAATKVRKPTKGKGKKAPTAISPTVIGKTESEQKDAGDGDKSTEGGELVDLVKSEAEDCDGD